MRKEIQLFTQFPKLLLYGDDDGVIYDRAEMERRLADGMQRTSSIDEFRKGNKLIKQSKCK